MMTPTDTGKVFGWSFLSRGVSPYAQESLFLDAFHGLEPWIEKSAKGEFTEADLPAYDAWVKTVSPKGSGQPGSGAIHNLGAFGKDFLLKMGQPGEDGITPIQKLHDMIADDNMTGPQIRREFYRMNQAAGIDNKVLSFTLLVTGRDDVLVLDRVQVHNLWDDGRYEGRNLYDGTKRYVAPDTEGGTQTFLDKDQAKAFLKQTVDAKVSELIKERIPGERYEVKDPNAGKQTFDNLKDAQKYAKKMVTVDPATGERLLKVESEKVPGSGLAELTAGSRGLLIYEALERDIAKQLPDIYKRLGRPEDASLGGYHWDSWVVDSGQEASHGTIGSVMGKVLGEENPLKGVYAKEGEYGAYAYGAKYGVEGGPHFIYSDSAGVPYRFSVDDFRQFLDNIKKPSNGVVPSKFKVTEVNNEPWYNKPEVNRAALDQQVHQYGSPAGRNGAAGESAAGIQQADEGAVPNGTRPAGRGVLEPPGQTAPLRKATRASTVETPPQTYYQADRATGDVKEGPPLGTFITNSEKAANAFAGGGNYKTVSADIRNPLHISSLGDEHDFASAEDFNQTLKDAGVKFKVAESEDQEIWRFIDDGGKPLVNAIKKAGYDAVVFPETTGYHNAESTLVFDKTKIKPRATVQ